MTGQGFQDLGLQATSTGGGCACCSPTSHATAATDTGAPAKQTAAGETVSAQFLVEGMTCAHCVRSVTEEVSAIDGVSDVAVDLNAGGDSPVTITSANDLDDADLRAAVDEAGYEVK